MKLTRGGVAAWRLGIAKGAFVGRLVVIATGHALALSDAEDASPPCNQLALSAVGLTYQRRTWEATSVRVTRCALRSDSAGGRR